MSLKLKICAAILLLAPGLAFAQVVNGDFTSGPASWTWSRSVFQQQLNVNCANTGYTVFSASSTIDTPWINSTRGRVGKITDKLPATLGKWTICRQIEQTVFVPFGAQMSLLVKIGEALSPTSIPRYIADGSMSLSIVDGSTATTVLSLTGRSRECPITETCPKFCS